MATKPVIRIETRLKQGREIIAIIFKDNTDIVKILKEIAGAVWSAEMRIWYIPAEKFKLSYVFEKLHSLAFVDYSALSMRKTVLMIPP